MMSTLIRLQKYCSQEGLASRRQAEAFIRQGLIKVNGQVVTELGHKIDPANDQVELLPQATAINAQYNYLILNKPIGLVSNLPQAGEQEANWLLPRNFRKMVHVVGRLDKDSSGLLFFTNDGRVANRLKSPEFDIEKEYLVQTDLPLTPRVIARYKQGFSLEGQRLKPVLVKRLNSNHYRFILREGKNRQIRRMLNNCGYQAQALHRLRIGILTLGSLAEGKWRALNRPEINNLLTFLNL